MSVKRKLVLLIGVLAVMLAASAVFALNYIFYGTISSLGQIDSYVVSLGAGQQITASAVCADPPTLDTVMAVYAPGGALVAANDDGGPKTCGGFRSSLVSFVTSATGDYTFTVRGFQGLGGETGSYVLTVTDAAGSGFIPNDDRINPHAFAPVAVYCRAEGAVEVWNIDADGNGTPLLDVSAADQAAGASAGGVSLNTLDDGRLQVNATMLDGKGYVFIFDGCPVTTSETYTVENGNAILFETRKY